MSEQDLQDWTPPRGTGFKVIAWVLIVLIVAVAVFGLIAMMVVS